MYKEIVGFNLLVPGPVQNTHLSIRIISSDCEDLWIDLPILNNRCSVRGGHKDWRLISCNSDSDNSIASLSTWISSYHIKLIKNKRSSHINFENSDSTPEFI